MVRFIVEHHYAAMRSDTLAQRFAGVERFRFRHNRARPVVKFGLAFPSTFAGVIQAVNVREIKSAASCRAAGFVLQNN